MVRKIVNVAESRHVYEQEVCLSQINGRQNLTGQRFSAVLSSVTRCLMCSSGGKLVAFRCVCSDRPSLAAVAVCCSGSALPSKENSQETSCIVMKSAEKDFDPRGEASTLQQKGLNQTEFHGVFSDRREKSLWTGCLIREKCVTVN